MFISVAKANTLWHWLEGGDRTAAAVADHLNTTARLRSVGSSHLRASVVRGHAERERSQPARVVHQRGHHGVETGLHRMTWFDADDELPQKFVYVETRGEETEGRDGGYLHPSLRFLGGLDWSHGKSVTHWRYLPKADHKRLNDAKEKRRRRIWHRYDADKARAAGALRPERPARPKVHQTHDVRAGKRRRDRDPKPGREAPVHSSPQRRAGNV